MKNKKNVLFMILLLLVGFAVVATGIVTDATWIQRLDALGNQVFRLDISREASELILNMTHVGSIRTLAITALAIGAFLLLHKKFIGFLWFGFSMATIGGLTPSILKIAFARPRPTDGLMSRGGYSFPSGHTMGTLALYGLIIILAVVYLEKSWQKHLLIIASLSIILLVSWSRIHLGVHFFTDIIGSLLLGISLLLSAWVILMALRQKFGKS